MDLARFHLKIFASKDEIPGGDAAAIEVFHDWIRRKELPGLLLIDVADYTHVAAGPGVVLVAFEANLSLNRLGGKLGLSYYRKRPFGPAPVEGALRAAFGDLLAAAYLLEKEERLAGGLKFRRDSFLFEANDRRLAPNDETAAAALAPALEEAARVTFPGKPVHLARRKNDARERLAFEIRIDDQK